MKKLHIINLEKMVVLNACSCSTSMIFLTEMMM